MESWDETNWEKKDRRRTQQAIDGLLEDRRKQLKGGNVMDPVTVGLLVTVAEKAAEGIAAIYTTIKNAGLAADTEAAYIARIDKAMAAVPVPHVG